MANYYSFSPAHANSNGKTGHVHKFSAPAINCSLDCVFKGDGCYAENFPLSLHWARQQAGESPRSVTWPQLVVSVKKVPAGDAVRGFEAGDFATTPDGDIDPVKLGELSNAMRGKRGWLYTHHIPSMDPSDFTNRLILETTQNVFTINLSIDFNEAKLDHFMEQGHSCVIAVPSTEKRKQWRTAGGNRIRVCPATTHKSVTCADCMLCHKRPSDLAIAFPAHGARKKAADLALSSLN